MVSPASWQATSPDQPTNVRHSFNLTAASPGFRTRMHSDEKERTRRHSAFVEKAKLVSGPSFS